MKSEIFPSYQVSHTERRRKNLNQISRSMLFRVSRENVRSAIIEAMNFLRFHFVGVDLHKILTNYASFQLCSSIDKHNSLFSFTFTSSSVNHVTASLFVSHRFINTENMKLFAVLSFHVSLTKKENSINI